MKLNPSRAILAQMNHDSQATHAPCRDHNGACFPIQRKLFLWDTSHSHEDSRPILCLNFNGIKSDKFSKQKIQVFINSPYFVRKEIKCLTITFSQAFQSRSLSAAQASPWRPSPVLCCAVVSFLDKRQRCETSSQVLINSHGELLLFIWRGQQLQGRLGVLAHIRTSKTKW